METASAGLGKPCQAKNFGSPRIWCRRVFRQEFLPEKAPGQFLADDQFTLADIAWMPNLRRYYLLRWPLERYPLINEWFKRASARDSFRVALEGWEPKPMLDMALPKLDERIASGDGVTAYGPLAA